MKSLLTRFICFCGLVCFNLLATAQTQTCLKNQLYTTDAQTILQIGGVNEIVFADLNNDTRTDMVVGTYVPYVDIYIQQANGQFVKTDSMMYNFTISFLKLQAIDIDNNGIKDILVQMDTGVVVIHNDGAGHISATDTLQQSAQVVAFKAGDYNDDGIVDVVLSTQSPSNDLVYKGLGANLYAVADTMYGESFPRMDIVDMNNDGKNDLFYMYYGSFGIYTKDANDSLIIAGSVSGSGFTHLELQDMNSDGLIDVVISKWDGIYIYKNLGGFNFVLQQHVTCYPENNFMEKDLFSEDMNGDGTKDIVIRNVYSTSVFYNIAGTIDSVNINTFSNDYATIALADFNNDAKNDVIVLDYGNVNIRVFYNKANGFFEGDNFMNIDATQPGAKRVVKSVDFDNDGDKDLAVFGSNGLDIMQNNNDRTWKGFGSIYLNSGFGTLNLTDFVFDQLDGNTNVDAILPPYYDNNIYIIHDITQWGNYSSMTTLTITNAKIIAGADFNNDGKKDFVVGVYAPTMGYVPDLRVYLNNGSGNFPTATYPFMFGLANQYNPTEQLVADDYDHDNDQDLFFHTSGNRIAFCKGTGGTTFANPVFIDGTSVTSQFLMRDVNNDNFNDFISRGYTDSIKVYLGNATGFSYYGYFQVPPYTADLTMADMNEDGNLDIVASDELNNNIEIYYGQGTGGFVLGYNVPYEGARSLLAENLDNDNHVDVVAVYNSTYEEKLRFYYADTLTSIITLGPSVCSDQVLNLQTASSSTIDWYNGATNLGLTNINPIAVTQSGVYTATSTTSYGCPLTTDSIYIAISACDSVWPGDANMNGVCDGTDLLSVGLNYGSSGIARSVQNNVWSAHAAADWGTVNAGLDLKFSDCNGDGVVDSNDTLAINQNFSSVHALTPINNNSLQALPAIHFVTAVSTYLPGQFIDVDIWLGTAATRVNDLYGIAFDINYDASLVEPGSEVLLFPNSWLGTPGTNAIKLGKIDAGTNTVHGAITRTDHFNSDGFGKIATLRFQASTSIATLTPMNFSSISYLANDSAFFPVMFNTYPSTITIDPLATSVVESGNENDLLVYPNPFKNEATIAYTLDRRSNVNIEIYNTIGQKIQTLVSSEQNEGRYTSVFSAEKNNLEAGIYFVKISIDGKTNMRRIVVEK